MVSVDGSSLTVAVDGTEEQVQVSAASVQPIAPSKGDTVWFFSCFFLVCCTVFSLSCACLCVCVCVCVCDVVDGCGCECGCGDVISPTCMMLALAQVYVLSGEHQSLRGQLVSIDGVEGVVKVCRVLFLFLFFLLCVCVCVCVCAA